MRKNPEKNRKWYRVFSAILLIGSLLLAGCAPQPDVPPTQPTDASKPTEPSTVTQPSSTPATDPTDDNPAESSLAIFRQAMVETPQLFAVAHFGYVVPESDDGVDAIAFIRKAAPQLCADLPFLLALDQDHIIGEGGQVFCIVPADEKATVAVGLSTWNDDSETYEYTDVIYRSENGQPILLMCNSYYFGPDTQITVTDSTGNVAVWYPQMETIYSVAPLNNSSGESLLFDFTSYDEIWNQGIDSTKLVGTWELAWTEVEGDRNEAEPGACTIQITPDESGFYRFTYSDRDFPNQNVSNRALIITPGEIYYGCGNDQWIGEVAEESGDPVQYALTLLEDGTLLLQTYWEMEGIPWVSYGWYKRIS